VAQDEIRHFACDHVSARRVLLVVERFPDDRSASSERESARTKGAESDQTVYSQSVGEMNQAH